MNVLSWILICFAGLCWGSFLNVLIVRTMSGESIIIPPSKCPKCGLKLLWWHKIPIVSYFILHGRCYFCNKSISIQYPIVEFVGLCITIFSILRYVSLFDALSVILVLSLLMVASITDIQINKISINQLLFVMFAGCVFNRYDIMNSIYGIFVGGIVLYLLISLGRKLFKKDTFGYGDIFLIAAMGSVVGFDKLFLYIVYFLIIELVLVLPKYVMALWRNEQIETLKYLIFFSTSCLFLYVFRNIYFWGVKALFIMFSGCMLFFAYKLIINLFNNIKGNETPSACPIAPAVTLAVLLYLI